MRSIREASRTVEASEPQREHVQCAYSGCQNCAMESKRKGNAIVKLCRQHAEREHMEETRQWLKDRNLITKEQKTAFRKSLARQVLPPSKEWAHKAIAAFDEGRSSPWALKLACDVLGVSTDYFLNGGRP